jgi:hypothetical protein
VTRRNFAAGLLLALTIGGFIHMTNDNKSDTARTDAGEGKPEAEEAAAETPNRGGVIEGGDGGDDKSGVIEGGKSGE